MREKRKNTKLTKKQQITLECIEWYIKEHGYSPTYREIAELLHSDYNTVYKKVMILQERGYITSETGKIRTMRVLKSYDKCSGIHNDASWKEKMDEN